MYYAYSNNGLSCRTVDSSYVAQAGEKVFEVDHASDVTSDQLTAAFSGYAAATQVQQNTAANAPILAQLSALDVFLPRAIEDYFTAFSIDTTKLPQVQQTRLTQKANLRAQLK